jgi:hypothetical protein
VQSADCGVAAPHRSATTTEGGDVQRASVSGRSNQKKRESDARLMARPYPSSSTDGKAKCDRLGEGRPRKKLRSQGPDPAVMLIEAPDHPGKSVLYKYSILHAFIVFLLVAAAPAHAHPVAWKGAGIVNAFHQPDMIQWQALYSWERNLSLGVEYARDTMEGPERRFLLARFSWLVHRWNGKSHQANVYLTGGVGALLGDEARLAAMTALEADYETQRVYFSAKASTFVARDTRPLTMFQGRAGFAPYEGGYDDIQAWVIAQAQYFPGASQEPLRLGPVFRVFYRNVLGELGVSAEGTWTMNFMVHW